MSEQTVETGHSDYRDGITPGAPDGHWPEEAYTETYRRDDGWEVVVTHDGEIVTALSHLPMIVQEPPSPLTIEYVRRACRAHGYGLVTPPGVTDA